MNQIVDAIIKAKVRVEPVSGLGDALSKGEMGAVVPFLSTMAAPGQWDASEALNEAPPAESLELEFVHGFQGHGCAGNIKWLNASEIVYRAAGFV
ncbi:hypothetical protein T484DRAFT_1813374, partial [Baffinella frigidus]